MFILYFTNPSAQLAFDLMKRWAIERSTRQHSLGVTCTSHFHFIQIFHEMHVRFRLYRDWAGLLFWFVAYFWISDEEAV